MPVYCRHCFMETFFQYDEVLMTMESLTDMR